MRIPGKAQSVLNTPFLLLLGMCITNTTINALIITKFVYMHLVLYVIIYIKCVCGEYLSYKCLCNVSKSKQKNRSVKYYKVFYAPGESSRPICRSSAHVHSMCSVCLVYYTYTTYSKRPVNTRYVTPYIQFTLSIILACPRYV
jgi:hypothetical protein